MANGLVRKEGRETLLRDSNFGVKTSDLKIFKFEDEMAKPRGIRMTTHDECRTVQASIRECAPWYLVTRGSFVRIM
jgi:hypothetical protein